MFDNEQYFRNYFKINARFRIISELDNTKS